LTQPLASVYIIYILFVASNKLSLDLDNEIITWTANENIWNDSIFIATNVISNTLQHGFMNRPFNLKRDWVGHAMVFFLTQYFCAELSRKNCFCKQNERKLDSDARFSPIKITLFWLQGRNHSPHPFQLNGHRVPY